jgi:uncharacterized protein DUF6847
MKLAEALNARADAQKRLQQIRQRVQASARHQEGEAPAEDPNELLAEADRVAADLERLITAINRTNVQVELEPGATMTDALAHRDVLGLRRAILVEAAQVASVRQDRYSRSEVKFVTPLDVKDLHRRADDLAMEYRELDAKIQAKNWERDLIE